MKCDKCKQMKESQKYEDICDVCVFKTMKKMWEKKLSPLIRNFIKQIKAKKS